MGIFSRFKLGNFSTIIQKIFGKKHAKIGIYGPPNVGKTTLANRILRDWTGDIMGSVSDVPHETRRAKWKTNIKIDNGSSSLVMDIVDTPGIATKIDYKDFMNTYGLSKEDIEKYAREYRWNQRIKRRMEPNPFAGRPEVSELMRMLTLEELFKE